MKRGSSSTRRHYLSRDPQTAWLSKRDEQSLNEALSKAREAGERNHRAENAFVAAHFRIVETAARKYECETVPFDDLVSAGRFALAHAFHTYNADKGRFSIYATTAIYRALAQEAACEASVVHIRDKAGATRALRRMTHVESSAEAHLGVLNYEDRRDLLVRKLSLPRDLIEEVLSRQDGDKSLEDVDRKTAPTARVHARLVAGDDSPEESFADKELESRRRAAFNSAIATVLNDRERHIIASRLMDPPLTLNELGPHFNVCGDRIRQIEAKALEKIKQHIYLDRSVAHELFSQAIVPARAKEFETYIKIDTRAAL